MISGDANCTHSNPKYLNCTWVSTKCKSTQSKIKNRVVLINVAKPKRILNTTKGAIDCGEKKCIFMRLNIFY